MVRYPSGQASQASTWTVSDRVVVARQSRRVWWAGKGDRPDLAKDLSGKNRKKSSTQSFALPGQRKYPFRTRRKPAMRWRVAQHGTPAEQKTVKAAVKKRFPSIGKKA